MNALQVYALLHEACRMLDDEGDNAIAAHVGLGMALIEEKYHVGQENLTDESWRNPSRLPVPRADHDGSWA